MVILHCLVSLPEGIHHCLAAITVTTPPTVQSSASCSDGQLRKMPRQSSQWWDLGLTREAHDISQGTCTIGQSLVWGWVNRYISREQAKTWGLKNEILFECCHFPGFISKNLKPRNTQTKKTVLRHTRQCGVGTFTQEVVILVKNWRLAGGLSHVAAVTSITSYAARQTERFNILCFAPRLSPDSTMQDSWYIQCLWTISIAIILVAWLLLDSLPCRPTTIDKTNQTWHRR